MAVHACDSATYSGDLTDSWLKRNGPDMLSMGNAVPAGVEGSPCLRSKAGARVLSKRAAHTNGDVPSGATALTGPVVPVSCAREREDVCLCEQRRWSSRQASGNCAGLIAPSTIRQHTSCTVRVKQEIGERTGFYFSEDGEVAEA